MFRVIIPKLTKNSDDSSNEWRFDDPLYPTKYVMKITRQYDLGHNDSMWKMHLTRKNREDTPFPSTDIQKVELIGGCDAGMPQSLSMEINGSFPRLLYQEQRQSEDSWMFAASPQSYCVFEITRVRIFAASIQ